MLAPIILFTYNRPTHTQKVLDALSKNIESSNSIIYIYQDGPKQNADISNLEKINQVQKIIHNENRFQQVKIITSKINLGLSTSIINGVSDVLDIHPKAIILEDDILVSKGFLKYMNEALNMYENDVKVGCIHAWNYKLNHSNFKQSTFFLKGADCWGWATWKNSWALFNIDGKFLLNEIISKDLSYSFNRNGTHHFVKMLENQIEGKNDSWAIRWHASLFLKNKYCLHPTQSIVMNIGLDNSGTHSGNASFEQNPIDFIEIKEIAIQEENWFFEAYRKKYINKKKSLVIIFKLYLKKIVLKFYKNSKKAIGNYK